MQIYTTGRIAKLIGVAPRTVSKWIDSGKLRGFRIPGSQDRRVTHANLEAFMAEYGIDRSLLEPEREPEPETPRVLIVGAAGGTFEETEAVETTYVRTPFAAGVAFGEVKPMVVVIDVDGLGRLEAAQVAATLRGTGVRVLAIGICDQPDPARRTQWLRDNLTPRPDDEASKTA